MTDISEKKAYPGEGHCWADFLHHRARVIDWMYSGECSGKARDDEQIAIALSMDPVQVRLIRTRDRSIDNG